MLENELLDILLEQGAMVLAVKLKKAAQDVTQADDLVQEPTGTSLFGWCVAGGAVSSSPPCRNRRERKWDGRACPAVCFSLERCGGAAG